MDRLIILFQRCFPTSTVLSVSPPMLQMSNLDGTVVKTKTFPSAGGIGSDIYEGKLFLDNGQEILVAIKTIRRTACDTCSLERALVREGTQWCNLKHRNVAPFLGVCYDLNGGFPCIISHFYRRGDAIKFLNENPSADRLQLIAQVLAGVCYLHGQKVVHGDIKAANVVVDDDGEALLIDFGLSRASEPTGPTTSSNVGTLRWMAPELFGFDESEGGAGGHHTATTPRVTFASDVWASSMTAMELFTGRIPFGHILRDLAVISAIQRGERPRACPEIISSDIWTLLERSWEALPANRPSAFALSTCIDVVSGLRRMNMRSLSVGEAAYTLEVIGKRAANCSSSQPLLPYECYWPSCNSHFRELVDCQEHQACHAIVDVMKF